MCFIVREKNEQKKKLKRGKERERARYRKQNIAVANGTAYSVQ